MSGRTASDESDADRGASAEQPPPLSAGQPAAAAIGHMAELTHKETRGGTSAEPSDDGRTDRAVWGR